MPVKKTNLKEYKTELRRHYRRLRAEMEPQARAEMDAAICRRVRGLREYARERVFFTYVSKEGEVDTRALIEKALRDGKRVAVPRCVPGTYEMEFYFIRSPRDLEPGMFGVLEPNPQNCERVEDFSHGLCLVPGWSFDARGYRLGYGKGYYDRFLSRFGGVTAGVCYHNCVRWQLPHGYFDRPVQLLVTDRYLRRTARKGS